MNRWIDWKLFALAISTLLGFALLQSVLVFLFKKPFLLSTLLSFITIAVLFFFLQKRLIRAIQSYYTTAIDRMKAALEKTVHQVSKEREDLQKILNEMTEGVLVVDERNRIRMVNNALRTLFPLPQEILGKSLLELIRHSELEEAMRQTIETGKTSTFELTLPSSPQKFFEVNVVPILPSLSVPSEEPEKSGAIAVFHDISRLKELEKVRQDFLANVSHELRTPLTTIKGYSESLLEGALNEEIAPSFVQVILKHTDRLTKIVEDLLIISKIESREFQLTLEPLSFAEVLDETLEWVEEHAKKKKVSMIKTGLPDSLQVKADRKYLEQILINLLDNAIKYNHEGGQVWISAALTSQNEVEIAIRDNGPGIPKEDLPRIFERFYRVDKGRSKELGGTGLGLSIVKHLVQAQGGRVWAESEPGEGATFYFTLPSPL